MSNLTADQRTCAHGSPLEYGCSECEIPKCDHDEMTTVNADGWCLICGEFV